MDGTTPEPAGPHPAVMLASILKVLAEPFTISDKAYAQRLRLLDPEVIQAMSEIALPFECLHDAGEIYMHCTYLDTPDKHEIKRVVNKWLRDFALQSFDGEECTRKAERKARPKLLIPIEWFSMDHSMFRCYADPIMRLRERFEVVGFYGGEACDDQAEQTFERIIHLPVDHLEFFQIVGILQAEAPDIILFPSIGMATWTTTLANMRLAPLQIMCPGHPATILSPYIDALFTEESTIGDRAHYSERVIGLPDGVVSMARTDGAPRPIDKLAGKHIAIPAMAAKLIPPFMRALQAIKQDHPDAIFHFFPNQTGLDHAMVDYEIRKWFPDSHVYARSDYQTYLDRISACSLALDSFPFGGTNSVVDCFMCGVPVVTLEGSQISERVGALRIRQLGLGEIENMLIARSPDEFVKQVCSLLRYPHWLPDMPNAEVLHEKFFAPRKGAFADAVWRVWEETCSGMN